jgi:hypothetical protein
MGCILAKDMTIECIFAKLSYLYGKVSLIMFKRLGLLHKEDLEDDDEEHKGRTYRSAERQIQLVE